MSTDRELIRRLADALAKWQLGGAPPVDTADADLITEARDRLAQPEPEGPTDEELYDLAAKYDGEPVASMQAALARWGPRS